ncbi:hypothetical protein ACHAW5_008313 [Stephanodiscus triporus]|uniref:Uncharacterized protein n=1 Tax=Stephanodiscus triporus TaxID=2934178 RepID=A0ABD3QDN9_9STRA
MGHLPCGFEMHLRLTPSASHPVIRVPRKKQYRVQGNRHILNPIKLLATLSSVTPLPGRNPMKFGKSLTLTMLASLAAKSFSDSFVRAEWPIWTTRSLLLTRITTESSHPRKSLPLSTPFTLASRKTAAKLFRITSKTDLRKMLWPIFG